MLLFSLYMPEFCFFSQLTFLLAFVFSTLPLMMRVRRFHACKDCWVCIIGVIVGGHYDQGRDSECKAFCYYFYIQQFCLCFWSAWLHINTDVDCHYDCNLFVMVILLQLLLSLFCFISSIFSSCAYVSDLLDCTSVLMLIMITAIMIAICWWW